MLRTFKKNIGGAWVEQKPVLFMFHYMLYFTGAQQWDLPVFQLVPSAWTLLRKQNIKQSDETIDAGRGGRWKAAVCPPKGTPEPGSTLPHTVSYMIIPLSLLVAEISASEPQKGDMRRTEGLMFQFHILATLYIVVVLFLCTAELWDCNAWEVRIHRNVFFFCPADTLTTPYFTEESCGGWEEHKSPLSAPVSFLKAGEIHAH